MVERSRLRPTRPAQHQAHKHRGRMTPSGMLLWNHDHDATYRQLPPPYTTLRGSARLPSY
eukprot:838522-Amphidinium_carterae.1